MKEKSQWVGNKHGLRPPTSERRKYTGTDSPPDQPVGSARIFALVHRRGATEKIYLSFNLACEVTKIIRIARRNLSVYIGNATNHEPSEE